MFILGTINPQGRQLCCRYRPKCWHSVSDLPPPACIANLLGSCITEELLEVAPNNEAEHWEPIELVSLHDQMLAEAGSGWDVL